jgi:hypothetical protein
MVANVPLPLAFVREAVPPADPGEPPEGPAGTTTVILVILVRSRNVFE